MRQLVGSILIGLCVGIALAPLLKNGSSAPQYMPPLQSTTADSYQAYLSEKPVLAEDPDGTLGSSLLDENTTTLNAASPSSAH
jgi:hypothetical protein